MNQVIVWEAVGIAICLIASAFFSSSETALTSLSGPQAQKLIEDRGAKSLALWVAHPIQVLTAILIGNNIFNITASALATDLASRLLGGTAASGWAIPVAVGVMTLLLLIFGEITPKALAKRMYKKVAAPMMTLLRVPYVLFYPFTIAFSKFTRAMMRALGNDPEERAPFVTAEEIEYMIDLGSREGTFSEDRERMLRSVFEFNDTTAREIMVPRTDIVFLSTEMDLPEVVAAAESCGHSRLPVYDENVDDIVGIFYVKDLIRLAGREISAGAFDIRAYARKPYFVPESKRIAELFAEFQNQHTHIAIVVDEFGGTDGMITLEDIVEEFFGEIRDEYDVEIDHLTPISEGLARADARLTVYDIEAHFGVAMPDDGEYETLGGFLMSQAGAVPSIGDEIVWRDLIFRVLEADEKKVISVEIERLSTALDDDDEESSGERALVV